MTDADIDTQDIVHVAVLPPDSAGSEDILRIAAVIGKEAYATRLLLAGKLPRVVAHCRSAEAAASMADTLKGMGLKAIVCTDRQLRLPPQGFFARSVEFGPGGVVFDDKDGLARRVGPEGAFLIVIGTTELREETETTKTRKKLNLPVTLLTGIPIRSKVTEKTTRTSVTTERFVRLYGRSLSDVTVDIRQYDFDYSCLGDKMAPSAALNFGMLVGRLKDVFPHAIFDDRLSRSFGVDVPFGTAWEKTEIACNLVYLFAPSNNV